MPRQEEFNFRDPSKDQEKEKEKIEFLRSALQESCGLNLLKGLRLNSGLENIEALSQELGIDAEPTEAAIRNAYEAEISAGYISDAEAFEMFAKERGFEVKPSKEALQRGYEYQLAMWQMSSAEKVADFAHAHGMNVEVTKEALKKGLEKFNIKKAREIAAFAKEKEVDFSIPRDFFINYFARYAGSPDILAKYRQEAMDFMKEQGVDLDYADILRRGFEMRLSRGDISGAGILQGFASEKDEVIEVSEAAARKAFESLIGHEYLYKEELAQYMDFLKKNGFEVDQKKYLQEAYDTQLGQHTEIDKIEAIVDFARERGVELETKKDLELDMCIRIFHNLELGHASSRRRQALENLKKSGSERTYEDIIKLNYLDYLNVPQKQRLDKNIIIKIGGQEIRGVFTGQKKEVPVQGKFIVGLTPEKNLKFVYDGTLGEHADIRGKYNLRVIGGGWLEIDDQNKKVRIYGRSDAFGYEPRSITRQVVSEAFKGYEVTEEK